MEKEVLLTTCPNGCHAALYSSNILVFEGILRECSSCCQLISSCSKEDYDESNQKWDTEQGTWPSKKSFERLLKRRKKDLDLISNLLSKKSSDIHILDVGCSNGSSVFIASNLGFHAAGVEPSEKAIQDGKNRGLNLHLGYLSDVSFDDNSFDAITLYEVIEHVATPIALLNECNRILRPNGILLIGTGNINSWTRYIRKSKWDYFDMKQNGSHISFFSPSSIGILASRTGFTIVKVITSSVKFYEKGEIPNSLYRIVKIFSELLNMPAYLFNKGHQMEVFLISKK